MATKPKEEPKPVAPAQQDGAASKADLDKLAGLVGTLAESVQTLAKGQESFIGTLSQAAEAQQRAASAPAPPPEPKIPSLDELRRAMSEGEDGGAEAVAQLVQGHLQRFRNELTPVLARGQEAISYLSTKAAASGQFKHAERFRGEIQKTLESYPAEIKSDPALMEQAYAKVYHEVVGQHSDELQSEAVEAALRTGEEGAAPPGAPSSASSAPKGEATAVPKFGDVMPASAIRALKDKYGDRSVDELGEIWAKARGFENSEAWVRNHLSIPGEEVTSDA